MLHKSQSRHSAAIPLNILLALLIFLLPFFADAAWEPGKFEIYLFNVGQADSQLIVSPTGKTVLIDAGERSWNGKSNADAIAEKLRQIMGPAFSHLDYIVATHLHTDHIGTAGYGTQTGYGGIWRLIEVHNFIVIRSLSRTTPDIKPGAFLLSPSSEF